MKEITVLLLDQMFSSTAIGPMEVFRHAGLLWNVLTGAKLAPHSALPQHLRTAARLRATVAFRFNPMPVENPWLLLIVMRGTPANTEAVDPVPFHRTPPPEL